MQKAIKPGLNITGLVLGLTYAFQEAIIHDDETLMNQLEKALERYNVRKKEDMGLVKLEVDLEPPKGWRLESLTNGKVILYPFEKIEQEQTMCFTYYRGSWYPIMLTAHHPHLQNSQIAGRVFSFVNKAHQDLGCNVNQAFYDTEIMGSAETVLSAPSEVVDWLINHRDL